MMKLTDLHPYQDNAKKHDETQIRNVMQSIKEYGIVQPLVCDKDNTLIIGHCRLIASKRLGLKEVPVVRLENLTEEEAQRLRLIDNKLNESEWDFELLAVQVPEVDFSEYEIEWDLPELEYDTPEIVEDEPPEEVEQIAQTGDVWLLGKHRLICGDSTDRRCMEILMDGSYADLVFTDPPYGVAVGDKNKVLNSVQKAGRCTENIAGDTMSEDELYDMLKDAFINIRENCKEDASYYVTSPQGGSLGLMMMMMKDAGLPVRHVLMWEKNTATFSIGRLDYDYQHEPIFYTWKKSHHNYRKGEFRTTVWKVDKPRKCDLHPTMKPIALIANALLDGSKEEDIVLDAFGGSGSTLIACEQLSRKCRMMELDEHYVDVIVQRYINFKGNADDVFLLRDGKKIPYNEVKMDVE